MVAKIPELTARDDLALRRHGGGAAGDRKPVAGDGEEAEEEDQREAQDYWEGEDEQAPEQVVAGASLAAGDPGRRVHGSSTRITKGEPWKVGEETAGKIGLGKRHGGGSVGGAAVGFARIGRGPFPHVVEICQKSDRNFLCILLLLLLR